MVRLFFLQDGKVKNLEISIETSDRLISYRLKNQVSVQQFADKVHNLYGHVTEELIIRYLDSKALLQ